MPRYIAAEVTLSFFGLGVNEPVPSWGNMLSALQQYSVLVSYGWLLAPVAALFVTSVIYYLLADTLHSRLKSRFNLEHQFCGEWGVMKVIARLSLLVCLLAGCVL